MSVYSNREVSMDQPNDQKPEEKSNVIGAWILILALLIIPVLVKYLFFPDNG